LKAFNFPIISQRSLKTMHFSLFLAPLFIASTFAAAFPEPQDPAVHPRPPTCPGTPFTTVAPSTVTTVITTTTVVLVPTTATIPHSCYTQVIPVPQSNNAFCGTLTSCGIHPDCVILETVTQPCKDTCCPVTPTVTTLGGCATCQTGCLTQTTYVPQTKSCNNGGY